MAMNLQLHLFVHFIYIFSAMGWAWALDRVRVFIDTNSKVYILRI